MSTSPLRIGELPAEFHLNPKTLRYYERIGLLPAPGRSTSGDRQYGKADRARLHFILQVKADGLSLDDIAEGLQVRDRGEPPCAHNTLNFSHYPLPLYPAAVRFMLTFVLPYAFLAFYPAAGLLRGEYARLGWLTLPVGVGVLALGLLVWQRGLAAMKGPGRNKLNRSLLEQPIP